MQFHLFLITLQIKIYTIFYSFKNSRTPVINSSIGIILNIILNIILSKYLGVSGIALATSISTIFISILLFYNLKKYDIYLEKFC